MCARFWGQPSRFWVNWLKQFVHYLVFNACEFGADFQYFSFGYCQNALFYRVK